MSRKYTTHVPCIAISPGCRNLYSVVPALVRLPHNKMSNENQPIPNFSAINDTYQPPNHFHGNHMEHDDMLMHCTTISKNTTSPLYAAPRKIDKCHWTQIANSVEYDRVDSRITHVVCKTRIENITCASNATSTRPQEVPKNNNPQTSLNAVLCTAPACLANDLQVATSLGRQTARML